MSTSRWLMEFGHLYKNADKYGIKSLLAERIGLDPSAPVPLVFPHAVDYYHAKILCDLHCREPLYVATREDIYEQVMPLRGAIRFPHPWLFLMDGNAPALGDGTLFIAPTPGNDNHEQLYRGIHAEDFAKPWGILLKDRGLIEEDFEWWKTRGIRTHCIGDHTNQHYFQDLKGILTGYQQVATAHFTSAAIFAASLSMRVRIIRDVCTSVNDHLEFGQNDCSGFVEDRDGKIHEVWSQLTSSDPGAARSVALHLLGIDFMGSKEELKTRYLRALGAIEKPLHLYPIRSTSLYNVVLGLIRLGIPVHKFYPSPLRRLLTQLSSALGFYRFIHVRSADFQDFGVVAGKKYYEATPMWRFNPLLQAHMGGLRFLPRWPFAKRRSVASVVGKRT